MTSEAPMKVSKTIEKETTNDRLADFKSRLKTSDIIISLHMGLGVSSVTSHMPHKSKDGKLIKGRSISIDWLNKFAVAFPFIDKNYMLDGTGEMFKRWSSTKQASFVHSTEWYKSKDKTTTKPHSVYASQVLVDKALKNKPFLEILIGIYEKSFGSGKLPTEVNIDICQRIRAIRESQEGLSGGSKCTQEDFAKMLNVTRSMIVSIELARQSPSTHFIQRLGHDFSDEPGMGLKQNGKSVRVSYDWLIDGKGEMFSSSSGGSDKAKDLKIKELEGDRDMYKQMVKDYQAGEQSKGFSH